MKCQKKVIGKDLNWNLEENLKEEKMKKMLRKKMEEEVNDWLLKEEMNEDWKFSSKSLFPMEVETEVEHHGVRLRLGRIAIQCEMNRS